MTVDPYLVGVTVYALAVLALTTMATLALSPEEWDRGQTAP